MDINKELLKKYEEAKTELDKLKAEIVQKENSLKNLKGYLEAEGVLQKPVVKKRGRRPKQLTDQQGSDKI